MKLIKLDTASIIEAKTVLWPAILATTGSPRTNAFKIDADISTWLTSNSDTLGVYDPARCKFIAPGKLWKNSCNGNSGPFYILWRTNSIIAVFCSAFEAQNLLARFKQGRTVVYTLDMGRLDSTCACEVRCGEASKIAIKLLEGLDVNSDDIPVTIQEYAMSMEGSAVDSRNPDDGDVGVAEKGASGNSVDEEEPSGDDNLYM